MPKSRHVFDFLHILVLGPFQFQGTARLLLIAFVYPRASAVNHAAPAMGVLPDPFPIGTL